MSSRQRSAPGRAGDERGAVAVLVSVLMSFVLIAIAAFAVDLGMQRAVRRDMQALADVVALDLARLLDGRTRADIEGGAGGRPPLAGALSASVANNDTTTLGDTGDVEAYLVSLDPDGGYATDADGTPQQVALGAVPDAAVVVAPATVDFAFGLADSGSATRSAVATSASTACLGIGSYAARLDAENSALLKDVLDEIGGGSIGMDLVSYRGLADASIGFADLAAELGLGSVDGLAEATVGFDELLLAAAAVLRKDGDTARADVLEAVAATVSLGPVAIGQMVELTPGAGAAETADIDVYSLVTGSVLVANGDAFVTVPELAVNLGVASLTTALTLIEGPRYDCGPVGTSVENSQLDLTSTGTLDPVTVRGLSVSGETSIDVDLAPATGVLADIVCGEETTTNPSGIDVDVTSGLLAASVSQSLTLDGTLDLGLDILDLLNLLGIDLGDVVTVTGAVELTVAQADPATVRSASVRVPPQAYGDPVGTGSGDLLLPTSADSVLGLDLSDVTVTVDPLLAAPYTLDLGDVTTLFDELLLPGLVAQVLEPLVTEVNDHVLTPVTDLLGISLGGADVFAPGPPSCSDPRLVG